TQALKKGIGKIDVSGGGERAHSPAGIEKERQVGYAAGRVEVTPSCHYCQPKADYRHQCNHSSGPVLYLRQESYLRHLILLAFNEYWVHAPRSLLGPCQRHSQRRRPYHVNSRNKRPKL